MNIGLVLSGGVGTRIKSPTPKQYLKHNGQMMITQTLRIIYQHDEIDAVYIVADESWHEAIDVEQNEIIEKKAKFGGFCQPGENRQISILNGLRKISHNALKDDVIMVHDAVRPLLSKSQITNCLAAINGHDGVMPVLTMKDTIYYSNDGRSVSELMSRSKVFAGQAPEFFKLGKYLKANERLLPDKILNVTGSTEPAILAGLDIVMVPGDEDNFKITTQSDLEKYYERIRFK